MINNQMVYVTKLQRKAAEGCMLKTVYANDQKVKKKSGNKKAHRFPT